MMKKMLLVLSFAAVASQGLFATDRSATSQITPAPSKLGRVINFMALTYDACGGCLGRGEKYVARCDNAQHPRVQSALQKLRRATACGCDICVSCMHGGAEFLTTLAKEQYRTNVEKAACCGSCLCTSWSCAGILCSGWSLACTCLPAFCCMSSVVTWVDLHNESKGLQLCAGCIAEFVKTLEPSCTAYAAKMRAPVVQTMGDGQNAKKDE